ncbi:IS4 family transposase [Deinococcus aquaedulcis]|uniref:IS4 family transposase n=1 Tax=Deinococcus aquaedulcis TaxID=2840455 RepID=UPI001C82F541|nr:IS4 family transposase [Deinococcus aquaedulcis]
MNNTRSRPPHDTLHAALKAAFVLDARRLAVLTALVLAIVQARSVVLYTLKNHVALSGTRAVRYQRLLRFVRFTMPDGLYTAFVLKLLPPGDLWLILDRTNWKLGKSDVNILLLSATWKSFSFPLLWILLPHGGSSAQVDRNALLARFLALRGERKVAGVLADREFVGRDWFTLLDQNGIAPCIRLQAISKLNGVPVWACFRKLQKGEVRVWHSKAEVYGVKLRVLATKNAAGEMLYLAYQGFSGPNLRRYAMRWQCENLHAALKTRGFNLEDTGLMRATRLSTLLVAVSLAFVWSCLTGEFVAARQQVKRKKHGYAEISVFRLGLDTLQDLTTSQNSA